MSNEAYRQIGDVVVYAISKCASESMATFRGVEPTAAIAFIRDPIERARSGFQFFLPFPADLPHAPTWEAYVDRILAGERNEHWTPQADAIEGKQIAKLYGFEQLRFVLPNLPHRHQSKTADADLNYRREELMTYYASDYELRARCGI